MPKIKYTATDANGVVHTRTTERTYTHTVVARYNRAGHMAHAMSTGFPDGSNYDYAAQIASGNDPYRAKNWRAENPTKWTASEIAEAQVAADEENAKRLANAQATTSVTREQYLAAQQADRVASAEAKDYDAFHNLGWCGRLDLAIKLAAKEAGTWYTDIQILEVARA